MTENHPGRGGRRRGAGRPREHDLRDRLTLRITPELKAILDGYCEAEGVTQSAAVEAALVEYLLRKARPNA